MNRKLTRSKTNRVIGGVCGGVGEYFDVDPVIIRIVWAAAVFLGGVGVILYILAWIIIPDDIESMNDYYSSPKNNDQHRYYSEANSQVKDANFKEENYVSEDQKFNAGPINDQECKSYHSNHCNGFSHSSKDAKEAKYVLSFVLIFIGIAILLSKLGFFWNSNFWGIFFGIALIAMGASIVFKGYKGK